MTLKQRSHTEATVSTIIAMLLLLLLLWLVYLDAPMPVEEEGIEVAFGDASEGGGYQPEQTPPASTPMQSVAPPPAPSQASHEDVMTQDDEESLALQKRKEEEKKKKAEEAERLRKEKEAQAKAEAERIAKEQALAEQRAREQAAKDKAAAMGALFGNNGSDATGSGDSQGSSQKGNPIGKGSIGGNEWSLDGRDAKAIPKPIDQHNQEGKVVVRIRVNSSGDVIDAHMDAGSTISDQATIKLALDAARNAKFSSSDKSQQVGTITYYFKFN